VRLADDAVRPRHEDGRVFALDESRVGPHAGRRHGDLDDVAHEGGVRLTQAAALDQELVKLRSERPRLHADLTDRPVEDRADESR
jgi:hypothetical protein